MMVVVGWVLGGLDGGGGARACLRAACGVMCGSYIFLARVLTKSRTQVQARVQARVRVDRCFSKQHQSSMDVYIAMRMRIQYVVLTFLAFTTVAVLRLVPRITHLDCPTVQRVVRADKSFLITELAGDAAVQMQECELLVLGRHSTIAK